MAHESCPFNRFIADTGLRPSEVSGCRSWFSRCLAVVLQRLPRSEPTSQRTVFQFQLEPKYPGGLGALRIEQLMHFGLTRTFVVTASRVYGLRDLGLRRVGLIDFLAVLISLSTNTCRVTLAF